MAVKMRDSVKNAIALVGTARIGTDKGARFVDRNARHFLSTQGGFESTVPSSGGFSVLGKNAFGEDVARDNITGAIGTVPAGAAFHISAASRGLGESKSPIELASTSKIRGKSRRTTSKITSTGVSKNKNKLGSSSILGSESILG
jgi:hypothetical protein